jgi:hypothetical protein
VFDQYLRRAELPVFEWTINERDRTIAYRWSAAERAFAMPIRVELSGSPLLLTPTTDWQVTPYAERPELKVPTDRYYVNVRQLDAGGRPMKP